MKTKLFGLALVLLVSIFLSSVAHAQDPITKSDTVTMNVSNRDSSHFSLQDFGPLTVGDTECHTIFLQNTLSEAIIVQEVYAYGGFFSKSIPVLPTVMLPGEIVSIAAKMDGRAGRVKDALAGE